MNTQANVKAAQTEYYNALDAEAALPKGSKPEDRYAARARSLAAATKLSRARRLAETQ